MKKEQDRTTKNKSENNGQNGISANLLINYFKI